MDARSSQLRNQIPRLRFMRERMGFMPGDDKIDTDRLTDRLKVLVVVLSIVAALAVAVLLLLPAKF